MRLRDNFDFYDAHDRECAKYEDRLPRCDGCGEAMEEWYEVSYKLQTWRFCDACVERKEYEE